MSGTGRRSAGRVGTLQRPDRVALRLLILGRAGRLVALVALVPHLRRDDAAGDPSGSLAAAWPTTGAGTTKARATAPVPLRVACQFVSVSCGRAPLPWCRTCPGRRFGCKVDREIGMAAARSPSLHRTDDKPGPHAVLRCHPRRLGQHPARHWVRHPRRLRQAERQPDDAPGSEVGEGLGLDEVAVPAEVGRSLHLRPRSPRPASGAAPGCAPHRQRRR